MRQSKDKIRSKLLSWYKENQRVLPWRGSKDPYEIWLSEIIMQQTRVIQGTPYYLKFVKEFPDIAALATADEQKVLKLWQGLGYYSRARNLHHAAKTILSDFNGIFPTDHKDIIKLKGVGSYTAAAITSIAYNQPYAALDGNVYRVLSRLFGIQLPINANGAKQVYQKMADELLDKKEPGHFNEAMMEFGATLCLPINPLCHLCPVAAYCEAFKNGLQDKLPLKKALKKPKSRYFHYLLIKDDTSVLYLKERKAGDIWQGLYDLPLIETDTEALATEKEVENYMGSNAVMIKPIKKMTHKLTHQQLQIIFYEVHLEKKSLAWKNQGIFVEMNNLKQYPLPKPIEIFLNDYLCNPKIW